MATNFVFRANVNFENETDRQDAYNRMLPELTALLPEELIPLNLEVPAVVATVLGALPEILALREDASKLASFDVAHIDQLESCALALSHAHSQHKATAEASDDLVELHMEAAGTRDRFHSDASNLVVSNLLDRSSLRGYGGVAGYKNVASDLLLLVSVYRSNWSKIEGKTTCTVQELDRADKLATRMLRLFGLREQAPAVTAAWADSRARAFTLLFRHYDAARRAVAYLRWHQGDADAIAPSLYAGRNQGKSSKTDADTPSAGPTQPAAPAPVVPPPPGGNGAAEAPRGEGLPGGSPFMQ